MRIHFLRGRSEYAPEQRCWLVLAVLVATFCAIGCMGYTSKGTSPSPSSSSLSSSSGANSSSASNSSGSSSSGSTSSGSGSSGSTSGSSSTSSASAGVLVASSSSLNFANVTAGQGTSLLVSVTNTGSTAITLSNVTASPTPFGTTASSNVALAPNQMYTVSVSFQPSAAGSFSGTLSIASDASNPLVQIALVGSATSQQSSQHSVTLNWTASTSPVSGYYVYRGSVSGGPYLKVNSNSDARASYTDSGVSAGQTYYYVVTSVNSSNVESGYSNQVAAAVP